MQPSATGSRSRSGCMTCRGKHRKCDEKQPLCSQCQTRGLECVYQTTLKWASVDNINSFDKSLRKRKRASKRASSAQSECTPRPRSPRPSSSGTTSAGIDFQGYEAEEELVHGDIDPQCDSNGTEPTQFFTSNDNLSVNLPSLEALHHVSAERDTASIQWHDAMFMAGPVNAGGSTEAQIDEESLMYDGTMSHTSLKFLVPNDEFVSAAVPGSDYVATQQDSLPAESSMEEDSLLDEEEIDDIEDNVSRQEIDSPTGYKSWVVDNTLNSLLFQIFQSPGEEIAFAYYLKRVCTCIPAFDGIQNSYRKLALVAISYPVLLHGILSVSTGHMYNYGRSNASLLSIRQSRALESLQVALNALQHEKDHTTTERVKPDQLLPRSGIFSILSSREIALAAIMMQTSSVLMTGVGSVEIHMKCALHFIQDLDYLHQIPESIFPRLLVYRFAMVDVVLAHLRFRRPMAPSEFFMYQPNEDLDTADPSFREMQGCPQRVLCFLAQVSMLSADLTNAVAPKAHIEAQAYSLETEMRIWGHGYYSVMLKGAGSSYPPQLTKSRRSQCEDDVKSDLDIVCECFYWIAHILLMRRVFLDPTRSTRVQLIRGHLFRLMDRLAPGCGPDSSIPFPFYMAAREALTPEDKDWVRKKHGAMMDVYRDRSREYLMASTEKIWEKASAGEGPVLEGTCAWETPHERFLRETDKRATYFMF